MLQHETVDAMRKSIESAKRYQHHQRLKIARELGVPSQLVDLYEVDGYDKVQEWTRIVEAILDRRHA